VSGRCFALSLIEQNYVIVILLFVAATWITVTSILAMLSGWFRLMAKFPNQNIEPLLRLRHCSGTMGLGVGMGRILTLSACRSGLRVGIVRVIGPFCREFLVPWESVAVARKSRIFWPVAKLQFGNPVVGTLTIPAHVADKLARASAGLWPEPGPFQPERHRDTFRRLLIHWAVMTFLAALFLTFAPFIAASHGVQPPLLLTILFPAAAFGIANTVRYFVEKT
jgi:hypothetical protein